MSRLQKSRGVPVEEEIALWLYLVAAASRKEIVSGDLPASTRVPCSRVPSSPAHQLCWAPMLRAPQVCEAAAPPTLHALHCYPWPRLFFSGPLSLPRELFPFSVQPGKSPGAVLPPLHLASS